MTHPSRLDSSLTGATWGSSISTGFCQESLKPKISHWWDFSHKDSNFKTEWFFLKVGLEYNMTVSALNTCNCPLLQVKIFVCFFVEIAELIKLKHSKTIIDKIIRSWTWVSWQTWRTLQSTSCCRLQETPAQVYFVLDINLTWNLLVGFKF